MKLFSTGDAWSWRGLQTRSVILVAVGVLGPLGILAWISWGSVRDLSQQLLAERQLLAKSVADHVEYVVSSQLEILQGASAAPGMDLEDRDPAPEKAAVREAYLRSRLLERVILLGPNGAALWEDPPRVGSTPRTLDLPAVEEALRSGRPGVSGLVTDPNGSRRLYALVPMRNWQGKVVGLVGGEIDPASPRFSSLFQPFRFGEGGSADLVDPRGVVIGSTDPRRLYLESDHRDFLMGLIRERRPAVGTCHGCHESPTVRGRVNEIIAFVPLFVAPWGISIRQPEAHALASAVALFRKLLWAVPVVLVVALVFAWGAARSLRSPLAVLTQAAERIASGDLTKPIAIVGQDEIGRLGRSLEEMRVALKGSLDEVAKANRELEQRVEERTRELERLNRELRTREELRGRLLRKVISAQEDERKRIARELHDETSQALTAMSMALEAALVTLPATGPRERLEEARALAVRSLQEIHRLIFDLRPSVLDDLGLPSAIRWYAERHLEPLGITLRCEFSEPGGHGEGRGPEPEAWVRRLPSEVETALFRVVQEAVTNIARHARAERVLIQCGLSEGILTIEIEDDGKGFDPSSITTAGDTGRGLGLQGMRERIELLQGTLEIESEQGQGTRIVVAVPVPPEVPRV